MNMNTISVYAVRTPRLLTTTYRLSAPAVVTIPTAPPVVTTLRVVMQAVNRSNTY